MSLFLGECPPFTKNPVHISALVFVSTDSQARLPSHLHLMKLLVAEELFQIYLCIDEEHKSAHLF